MNDEGRLPAASFANPNLGLDCTTPSGRASLAIRVDDRGGVTAWIEADTFESEARLAAALERTSARAIATEVRAAAAGIRQRREAQRPPFAAAVDALVRTAGSCA